MRRRSWSKRSSKQNTDSKRTRESSAQTSAKHRRVNAATRTRTLTAQLRRAQAEVDRLQKQLAQAQRRPAPSRERPVNKRSTPKTSRPRISRLPEPSAQVFHPDIEGRVNSALRNMRAGESITAAARAEGLDVRTLRRHAGNEIYETRSGEVRARKRITRSMPFLGTDGELKTLRIRGGAATSLNAEYWSELQKALRSGQLTEFEAKWRGTKVNGREVLSDAAKLSELAEAGVLNLGPLVMSSRARAAGGAR